MVEAMGGQQSAGYTSFRSKACQAFKILRRNAKLILNLLTLMVDANIKDLAAEGPVAILKVRLRLARAGMLRWGRSRSVKIAL